MQKNVSVFKRALTVFSLLFIFCLAEATASSKDIHDMRVAVLGDSMSWIGGESCSNPNGWTYHFYQDFRPKTIDIYARSGATWTNTTLTNINPDAYSEVLDNDNVIYNQVIRLLRNIEEGVVPAPDIIILYAGANDAWFHTARPGIFNYDPEETVNKISTALIKPSDHTSLTASLLLDYSLLKTVVPDALILFVTPFHCAKITDDDIERVAETIAEAGEGFGEPVIRLDRELPITRASESGKLTYTYDGIHTNPIGAKLISDFIGNSLISILSTE